MIDWRTVDRYTLEPVFRRDVEQLLTDSPHWWRVTSGYRSLAAQKVLRDRYLAYRAFKAGTGPSAPFAGKAARPGMSAHNYGLAIDVVPDGWVDVPGFQPDWQPNPGDAWYWLATAIDLHPRLRHGRHFADWPHIQRLAWAQYKHARTQPLIAA